MRLALRGNEAYLLASRDWDSSSLRVGGNYQQEITLWLHQTNIGTNNNGITMVKTPSAQSQQNKCCSADIAKASPQKRHLLSAPLNEV